MPLRLVLRVRFVAVGMVEVMHGFNFHPGGIEYAVLPYGALVLVPIDFAAD